MKHTKSNRIVFKDIYREKSLAVEQQQNPFRGMAKITIKLDFCVTVKQIFFCECEDRTAVSIKRYKNLQKLLTLIYREIGLALKQNNTLRGR